MPKIFIRFLLLIFLSLISCNKDDDNPPKPQSVTNFERTGLLGEKIVIEVKDLEVNKLQVFFDYEKAQVHYFSDTEVEVIVPRTLERYNPTLKVIDLNENKTILEETFTLKTPIITGFSANEITFDEDLVITGENFDTNMEFVKVSVNAESAKVLYTEKDKIHIHIPEKIEQALLIVTVSAQLQEVTASQSLILKKPEIISVDETETWLGNKITVRGINFNPNTDFAKIYTEGVATTFGNYKSNDHFEMYVPYGPHINFVVEDITYEMAGYSTSFKAHIPINDNAVMVDVYPGGFTEAIIVFNDKAYAFTSTYEEGEYGYKCELHEFSPETEKWRKIESFGFDGYYDEVVFDNDHNIYIYKSIEDNFRIMTKLDMNDFSETEISLPFNDNRFTTTMFHFQGNLYILNGKWIDENYDIKELNQRFKYKTSEDSWEDITYTPVFMENTWAYEEGIHKYIYLNDDLYFRFNSSWEITYKLNSDLTLELVNNLVLFKYEDFIITQSYLSGTSNTRFQYMFSDTGPFVDVYLGSFSSIDNRTYFAVGGEVYFIAKWYYVPDYLQNHNLTNKIRKESIDEILHN